MKAIDVLRYILTAEELETFEKDEAPAQEEDILNELIRKRLLLVVDWSGEEEPFQINRFLQERAAALADADSALQLEEQKAYASMDKEGLERGDHVPFLLRFYEKRLKKQGFTISMLDRGNDAFYLVLTTAEAAKPLRKTKSGLGPFVSLQAKKTIALFTIYCPNCKDMGVWELGIRDPFPEEESCQACGQPYSDAEGNLLVPYEKDLC